MVDTVPMRFGAFGEFTVLICDVADAVPHFHLVKGFPDLPEWQARIRMDRAEYLGRERQLNPQGKRALMRFLNSRDRQSLGGRNWAGLISSWTFYNPRRPFDSSQPMPDFTQLPTDLSQDFDHGGGLWPKTTGLPMIIYVSDNKFELDHDRPPRVYVQTNHFRQRRERSVAALTISAHPQIVAGRGLLQRDYELAASFIRANRALLLRAWNTEVSLGDVIGSIRTGERVPKGRSGG